jgi:hypothetical protein
MAIRLSALRASHPSPPGRYLVLISVRGRVDHRATMWLEGLVQLIEKSSGLIGNRTRNLPACSIVPQPATLLCALTTTVRTSNRRAVVYFIEIWMGYSLNIEVNHITLNLHTVSGTGHAQCITVSRARRLTFPHPHRMELDNTELFKNEKQYLTVFITFRTKSVIVNERIIKAKLNSWAIFNYLDPLQYTHHCQH